MAVAPIHVRALERVEPQRLALAFRLLNTEVLPALHRVLGLGLRYPDIVHLRAPAPGEPLLGSAVRATFTPEGEVTSVEPPCVALAEDEQLLRLLLLYELAQFHELATRKQARIEVDGPDASALWCAYFAHRVVSAAGLVPVELLQGTGLGLAKADEVLWRKALSDVGHAEVARRVAAADELADSLEALAGLDLPDSLFRVYPDWDKESQLACGSFFSGIGALGRTVEQLADLRREREQE